MPGIKLYIGIWVGLVVATLAEVAIRVTTSGLLASVITVLLLIAAGKAISIALYYQHLRYESRRLAVLPIAAIIGVTFLGIAAGYSLSMGNPGM